jgi:molybdate/tungstate transport system substrate-binding protein
VTRKLLLFCALFLMGGCTPAASPTAEPGQPELPPVAAQRVPLVVFAAGSLIIPFGALEKAFEQQYPHIDVRAEYHGSIQVIRHATELHDEIDVVVPADATLIPMLMAERIDPDTERPYAEWTIRFATNRLALAYTPQSKRADEIDTDNWYEILFDRDVRVGLSDPRFDASGYRTLMALALAQDVYGRPTLFREMFDKRFTMPVTIFVDDDLTTITVPEILETQPHEGLIVRGSSIQLIALLQSGDVDYAFEYESVIRQHGLEMVPLPETLNLGADGIEAAYGRVQVDLDFQRFSTVQPRFRGERIGYGITIPSSARHPEEAVLFITFLLGPEGRAVMEAHAHPMFDPPTADRYDRVPIRLQPLCVPGETP